MFQDFANLDIIGYVAIAVLPLVGFYVGARWAQHQAQLKNAEQRAQQVPLVPPVDSGSYRLQESLDSIHQQLAELAERQNFTERILSKRADTDR